MVTVDGTVVIFVLNNSTDCYNFVVRLDSYASGLSSDDNGNNFERAMTRPRRLLDHYSFR